MPPWASDGTGANQVHSPTGETFNALVDMSQCDKQGSGTQEGKQTRFAEVTAKSTRASNTSSHLVDAYFTDRQDQNNDGDTTDTDEESQYLAQASVTKGPTTTNPFGEFTFNWAKNTDDVAKYDKGSLVLGTETSGASDFNFINKMKGVYGLQTEQVSWANGNLNIDGSGGKIKVSHANSGTTNTYKVRFNTTHANVQKNTDTAVCYDLDESTMTPYVYSYNLYDETTGALKNINAGLEFVYDDNGTKDGRGYAGQYKHWNGSAYVDKTWMWTSGNDEPVTIYKESNQTLYYSVEWASHVPTISDLTFDPRIEIQASYTDSAGNTQTEDLNYEGPGQLWGIDWTDTNGVNTEGGWKPAFSLANGTTLTDSNGTDWKVKQTGLWKEMSIAAGACTTIPVTDGDVSFTIPTLTDVTTVWSDKPTPTIVKAKIVHGVKQF